MSKGSQGERQGSVIRCRDDGRYHADAVRRRYLALVTLSKFMYVTPAELKQMVLESQSLGHLTEDLALAVRRIASGYLMSKPNLVYLKQYWNDWVQSVVLIVALRLSILDPSRNLFAWITQATKFAIKSHYDRKVAEKRYWQEAYLCAREGTVIRHRAKSGYKSRRHR